VASGEIDGAAIDSQVLEVELRDRPELARQLRVVDSFGPSTIQPIAVSRRVPAELREAIRQVLLAIHQRTQVRVPLALGGVERFVSVDAHSYDDVRQMLDACVAADFLELR
jgi:phosphonate transport system substrate-binding protein